MAKVEKKIKKEEKPFVFEEYIKETEAKNRRDLDIIIHYWETKKYQFPSKAAANADLVRNLKAAAILRDYPDERLVEVMNWLEANADYPWKLETVVKYVNENLIRLRTQKPRI